MDLRRKTPRLIAAAAGVVIVAALYLARDVLIPFALAVVISFVLAPVVARLQRAGWSRRFAVLTAVVTLLACGSLAGWFVLGEVRDLAAKLPQYRENIREKSEALRSAIAAPYAEASRTVTSLSEPLLAPEASARLVADPASPPAPAPRAAEPESHPSLSAFTALVTPIALAVGRAAMVLLFVIVLLLYREDLRDRFIGLVGNGQVFVATQALDDAARRVSRFLSRQLLLNGLLGAVVGVVLIVIGVPDALLWGVAFAALRFVPYVGVWIAVTPPVLLAFATAEGWAQPLQVIALYAVLELLAYFWFEPQLYAGGSGISPMAILVSTLFWSWLWGPLGLILATPLTVCFVVLGKYVPQASFLYVLFNDEPALSAPQRLYQRLLAQDQDEAWTLLSQELRTKSSEAIADEIVVPALALAERDRQIGNLDDITLARICDAAQVLLDEIADAAVGSRPEPLHPSAAGVRVLCLPARSGVDVVSAGIVARDLAAIGAQTTLAPLTELVGETLERCAQTPFDVVCVSAVPPSRFMHVRYICKRIARECPDIDIVVVLWTLDLRSDDVARRLPSGERVHVVASLLQARAKVVALAASSRLRLARSVAS